MSFTERAGLFPVLLLLTGCAQPAVVTGPPSSSVVDSMLSLSAADISAMQYRIHQSGPSAQRPAAPSGAKTPSSQLLRSATSVKSPVMSAPITVIGAGPADGFVRQGGAAPTLRAALRNIVPPGHTVVFDKAVSADAPELWRWSGNDRWPYVVDRLLAARALKATVNAQTQTVKVELASRELATRNTLPASAPAGTINTVTVPTSGRNPFHGEGPTPASDSRGRVAGLPVVPPAPATRVWKIERGTTLRQGYALWVSQEICSPDKGKWTVRWDTGTNYPIDYTLTFRAVNFEDATSQLFTLWRRAQVPLFVSGYRQQCLVVISDGR